MPAFDAFGDATAANGTSLGWTHVIGAGSDRVLYAALGLDGSGNVNPVATFAGVAGTRLTNLFGQQDLALFRWINPPVGSGSIAMTWDSAFVPTGVSLSLTGVDQTTPDNGTPTTFEAATGTSVSHSVASAVGNYVIDALSLNAGALATTSAGIGQTDVGSEAAAAATFVGMSFKDGAASTTMGWTWTTTSTRNAHALLSVNASAGATLDQSAYQFRNDDGSESGATDLAAENTGVTLAPGMTARVRGQVNATGDPAATSLQWEYRKVGDPTYKKVT